MKQATTTKQGRQAARARGQRSRGAGWMAVELNREADGRQPHLAEVPRVPGALAYGSTPAEATQNALVIAGDVLGERAQLRGELLVEWLNLIADRGLGHVIERAGVKLAEGERACRKSRSGNGVGAWECHPDCLVLRTMTAIQGDGNLPMPSTEVGTVREAKVAELA